MTHLDLNPGCRGLLYGPAQHAGARPVPQSAAQPCLAGRLVAPPIQALTRTGQLRTQQLFPAASILNSTRQAERRPGER